MSTNSTADVERPSAVASLSDAERKRLSRKDVGNRALEVADSLGVNLQAWYLVACYVQRAQVQNDRAGAMMAVAQQHSAQPDVSVQKMAPLPPVSKPAATMLPPVKLEKPVVKPEPAAAVNTTSMQVDEEFDLSDLI
jgi:hypothetical protein